MILEKKPFTAIAQAKECKRCDCVNNTGDGVCKALVIGDIEPPLCPFFKTKEQNAKEVAKNDARLQRLGKRMAHL